MRYLRRYAVWLILLAGLGLAAGCSSASDSAAISAQVEATSASQPTVAATSPPVSAPTAVALPTLAPERPTAMPSPVPTDTGATEQAVPVPTESAQADPTAEPVRPIERGLLEEQFCVIDIVAPDTLNLRSGPSVEDTIVDMLIEDQCRIYPTGNETDGWREVMVDLPDDEIRGWVSGRYIAARRAPIDPDAPMTTITISVEYLSDSSSPVPLDAFRLVDADGLVVGYLDAAGRITVPDDMALTRVRIEAAWADDPYCAWTGQLRFLGFDNQYSSELGGICA